MANNVQSTGELDQSEGCNKELCVDSDYSEGGIAAYEYDTDVGDVDQKSNSGSAKSEECQLVYMFLFRNNSIYIYIYIYIYICFYNYPFMGLCEQIIVEKKFIWAKSPTI